MVVLTMIALVRIREYVISDLISTTFIAPSTNESDTKSDMHASSVIGGSVGGAILLLIILVFCVVICLISWSRKNKSYKVSNRELAKMDSQVMMTTNPCYDIHNQNRKEETQYEYIECDKIFQCVPQDDKKAKDVNPSYGNVQETDKTLHDSDNTCTTQPGCNVAIQIHPSCSSNSIQISEDQDGYVKTDQYHSHSGEVADYLEIIVPTTKDKSSVVCTSDIDNLDTNPNPSYDSVSGGINHL